MVVNFLRPTACCPRPHVELVLSTQKLMMISHCFEFNTNTIEIMIIEYVVLYIKKKNPINAQKLLKTQSGEIYNKDTSMM